jgi:acyl-CoA thioester hydrolase
MVPKAEAAISQEVDVKIQFYDVDPMNIVWHGNYVRFLEQARCALLDKIGFNYEDMNAAGYAFPVVDLRLKFVRPASFGQTVRVKASLIEWENRIRIDYLVYDPQSGEKLTKGQTTQLAVDLQTQETRFDCPDVLLERVAALQ